jgi:hypothetical protein
VRGGCPGIIPGKIRGTPGRKQQNSVKKCRRRGTTEPFSPVWDGVIESRKKEYPAVVEASTAFAAAKRVGAVEKDVIWRED